MKASPTHAVGSVSLPTAVAARKAVGFSPWLRGGWGCGEFRKNRIRNHATSKFAGHVPIIELRRQPLTWRSCVEEGNFMMELGDEGGSREGGREQGEMGIVLVTD